METLPSQHRFCNQSEAHAATLKHFLTIVVTTSPIPSMPSTALLEALFRSLQLTPALPSCHLIITADGVGTVVSDAEKPNYKKSKIQGKDIAKYTAYVENIRRLLESPSFSDFKSTELLALSEWKGFSGAVRAAVESVKTPFVMVMQHDQLLLDQIDVLSIIKALQRHSSIVKYVGLPSRTTTVGYARRIQHRYGISLQPFNVPELEVPLMPLLMWYDKPHIVCREHLKDFVFNPEKSGIDFRPGEFIEDVLGQHQLDDIKRNGLGAHAKYGTFVLDTARPLVYHLSGRKAEASAPEASDSSPDGSSGAPLDPDELAGENSGTRSFIAAVEGLRAPQSPEAPPLAPGSEAAPSYKFRGVCYRCGQKGHSFRYCSQRSTAEGRGGG